MSAAWMVINLGRGYSGIEIEQGEGFAPTKIKVPFDTVLSAFHASGELSVDVVEDNPVIMGNIVTGDDNDDHSEQHRDPDVHAVPAEVVRELLPGLPASDRGGHR